MLKQHISIIISSGWALRNYIHSGLIKDLSEKYKLSVFLPEVENKINGDLISYDIECLKIANYKTPKYFNFLHTILVQSHNKNLNYWHQELVDLESSFLSPAKRVLYKILVIFSKIFQNKFLHHLGKYFLFKILNKFSVVNHYCNIFKNIKPDLLLTGNPFNINEVFISTAAELQKIQSIASITSWDNLSYLGFIFPKYSEYIVWGDIMREELLLSDAKIKDSNIHNCSSIQFDFHFKSELLWDKEKTRSYLKINNNNQILLYTAGTFLTFPDESIFVDEFCKNILSNELGVPINIILRLHPNDNSDRFQFLEKKYSFLIIQRPWGINKKYFWWFEPSIEEITLLSNTLILADINISAWSTAVIDSLIVDTPSICISFSPSKNSVSDRYFKNCINMTHTKKLYDHGAIQVADNMKELFNAIKSYLKTPNQHKEQRFELVKNICGINYGASKKEYIYLISKILEK
jgi:hypothetical protein